MAKKNDPGISAQALSRLMNAAAKARDGAVAPYSNFRVGAALLTASGELIIGANVESASYGLTCCAERVALFNALTGGKRNFIAVAVVARVAGGPMPCGACRQLLAEYASDAKVFVADTRKLKSVKEFSVRELLPGAFLDFRPA
ncbi:MAG TPA: cytidine deaminase [Verrucomicrobiae bacterium]|jgi:cytidine deaminase|nr:cytidine deaminase [Verrucomicrobiae bacterium]